MNNSQLSWNSLLHSAAATGLALVLTACGGGQTNDSSATLDTAAPGWVGTKTLGAAGAFTNVSSIATDASGNVYVAGGTEGALDGNLLLGEYGAYVTKYNSSGVKQYTRMLTASQGDLSGNGVATDASGNVYLAGTTNVGLDGNSQAGWQDFFLTKYDSNGVKQYTRQLGAASMGTSGISVATDASGNVYVAGDTEADLETLSRSGVSGGFVIKYNSNGVKQFIRQLDAPGGGVFVGSVATDASGNVYLAGHTSGTLDDQTKTGNNDLFVTKYNASGVKQYTRQLGAAGGDTLGSAGADVYVKSVATDASGNVYVAGHTNGALDGQTKLGFWDTFFTKYNSLGVKQYTRQFGVVGSDTYGQAVATDASGNVFLTGETGGALDGIAKTGSRDLFVTKYNSSGDKQYTRLLGAAGAGTDGKAVATDASGNVFASGDTNGALDGNVLVGTSDLFVTKYNSSGMKQ
jgi:hypothetical protein